MTDWDILREACLALLAGDNPYSIGFGEMRFFNPPWTLIPLMPLAILPPGLGFILNGVLSFAAILFVTRKLDMGLWGFFWVAISPLHLHSVVYGNITWLPLLGILLPAPIALTFFSMKPQITFGWMVLTLVNAWQGGRYKRLALVLAPTVVMALLSLILWGIPSTRGADNPGLRSLFPYSLLIGIPALIYGIKHRDYRTLGLSSPFLSTYITFNGYLPALFPFKRYWLALAVAISFIPVVLGLVV